MKSSSDNRGVGNWYGDPDEFSTWANDCVQTGLYPTEQYLFGKYLPAPGRVLNIGCGGGREAIALSRMGHEVVAVDLLEPFLEAAKENANAAGVDVTFETGDVCDLKYADGVFDSVVMVGQLIGHVRGREKRIHALKECKRVVKDDGWIAFSTNAIEIRARYRLYFQVVNNLRKIYNPHNLEPGDAFPFRTGGRMRLFDLKKERMVFHWYTREEFLSDLEEARLECVETRRRCEMETDEGSKPLKSGETFYMVRKPQRVGT